MFTNPVRFRPAVLSSCKAWFSGGNPSNGALPANSASLAAFANLGNGTSITCTQATGANQATFATNQYNGKGCAKITTSTNYAVSGITFASAWTMFLVVTPSATTSTYYFGTSNAAGAGPTFISKFTPAGTTLNYEFYDNTDRLTISQSATGLNILAVTQVDGGNIFVYLNGTQVNSKNPATINTSGFLLNSFFCSSAGNNQGQYDFGDFLYFNAVLSTADFKSVSRYLGDYWGITVA